MIYYTAKNEFYYLRFQKLKEFWDRAQNGGRKSFRYEEIESEYKMEHKGGVLVPYLDTLKHDLDSRE